MLFRIQDLIPTESDAENNLFIQPDNRGTKVLFNVYFSNENIFTNVVIVR